MIAVRVQVHSTTLEHVLSLPTTYVLWMPSSKPEQACTCLQSTCLLLSRTSSVVCESKGAILNSEKVAISENACLAVYWRRGCLFETSSRPWRLYSRAVLSLHPLLSPPRPHFPVCISASTDVRRWLWADCVSELLLLWSAALRV
jgi:hypothetical protein